MLRAVPGASAPRFGARALAVAAAVALVAGATTGAALERPALGAADGLRAGSAAASAETSVAGGAGPELSDAGGPGDAASASAEEQQGPSSSPEAILPTIPAPVPTPEPTLPPGLTEADVAAGLLSADVPPVASGRLVVVPGSQAAPVTGVPVRTVRVEVEEGLAVDGAVFAARVMEILNDPRGWGADGSLTFARTDGDAEIRVVLASPATVDAMCAPLETVGLYSCGRNGHAALNHLRWVQGAAEFPDLSVYRDYLVNHEVGHLLGKPHVQCGGDGLRADVMQQQTIRVAPCTVNGWPFPDAG